MLWITIVIIITNTIIIVIIIIIISTTTTTTTTTTTATTNIDNDNNDNNDIDNNNNNIIIIIIIIIIHVITTGVCEQHMPFALALATRSSSRSCNPAPDLVFESWFSHLSSYPEECFFTDTGVLPVIYPM